MSRDEVWLLSAYHADSHAWWARWLVDNLPFAWRTFTLPGRHFRWRIRGNPLSWLDRLPRTPPGAIVATSMVDLATLRGIRADLCGVPTLLYFHENQFAYPVSDGQHPSIDPQMVQLYAALAADRLVFNSAWNRDSFLHGIDALCGKVPDHCPRDIPSRLAPRSDLLPVPVRPVQRGTKSGRLILWNHRWEHDKAPGLFADALERLARSDTDFQLALLGPRPQAAPPALQRIRDTLGERVLVDKQVPDLAYRKWLTRSDIVVSTAQHEFQGISVLEAVSGGAAPLVPDALCYPEQYPAIYRYPPGDAEALAERLAKWLGDPPPAPDVSPFLEGNLRSRWFTQISQLLDSRA